MMNMILLLFFCTLLFCSDAFSVSSFPEAKKIAVKLFKNNRVTLYCQCKYDQHKKIDLKSCHMQSANHIKRAQHMEWEHMMPAEHFGKHLKCWQEDSCKIKNKKGRQCCSKIDNKFKEMEGELYNLWPTVGLVNQARSNYRYSPIEKNTDFYGCPFKIDAELKKVEPADYAKGIVARANLFMSKRYHINLSPSQQKIFKAWNKQFPPSAWEKEWASHVAKIQGYENQFISHY